MVGKQNSVETQHEVFQRLSLNERGRDFVVGDLHGHLNQLKMLLAGVRFDPANDRLICVGDLVDHGPQSAELVLFLGIEGRDWFFSVRGNHDGMMLAAMDGNTDAYWVWQRENGGSWWAGTSSHERQKILQVVASLPLAIEVPMMDGRSFGVVHAQVPPGRAWNDLRNVRDNIGLITDDHSEDDSIEMVWGRSRIVAAAAACRARHYWTRPADRRARIDKLVTAIEGIDLVIHGHSVLAKYRQPVQFANMMWIDTGVYFKTSILSMVEPLTGAAWRATRKGFSETSVLQLPDQRKRAPDGRDAHGRAQRP